MLTLLTCRSRAARHDISIADDLHRSGIDAREALADALACQQGEGTAGHFLATDEDMHAGLNSQWCSQIVAAYQSHVVVPGQPVVLSNWFAGKPIISEKLAFMPPAPVDDPLRGPRYPHCLLL